MRIESTKADGTKFLMRPVATVCIPHESEDNSDEPCTFIVKGRQVTELQESCDEVLRRLSLPEESVALREHLGPVAKKYHKIGKQLRFYGFPVKEFSRKDLLILLGWCKSQIDQPDSSHPSPFCWPPRG